MKTKRTFRGKKTDMLFASLIIANSFKTNLIDLSIVRTNWTLVYANNLVNRIEAAISKYLGENTKMEQMQATSDMQKIQQAAMRDVGFLKTIIDVDFANDKNEHGLILKTLGFERNIIQRVHNGDQESLAQLLFTISNGLNNGMLAKLAAKGTNPELLNRIAKYAGSFQKANTQQENLKGSSKVLTAAGTEELNKIYDEIIAICKIAN